MLVMGMKTDSAITSIKFAFQAVEIEFAEEAESNYQHRDKQKETNVLEWIARCILEPLQVRLMNYTFSIQELKWHFNFKGAVQIDFFLRDGVRICQLMNKIKADSINKQDIITGNIEAHKNNIQLFIEAAAKYGVPDKYLFQVKEDKVKIFEKFQG